MVLGEVLPVADIRDTVVKLVGSTCRRAEAGKALLDGPEDHMEMEAYRDAAGSLGGAAVVVHSQMYVEDSPKADQAEVDSLRGLVEELVILQLD